MKRVIPLALLALFSANFLVACNTVKGAAKAVQKVGQQVEEAADDTGATEPRCRNDDPSLTRNKGGAGIAGPTASRVLSTNGIAIHGPAFFVSWVLLLDPCCAWPGTP